MKAENQETAVIDLKTFLIPLAILMAGIMIAAALFLGLKVKDSSVEIKNSGQVGGEQIVEQPVVPTSLPPQPPAVGQKVVASIDDDPIMGNKNTARIAIIEFSDFECPFCERFWSQTLPQIKENYIDTDKAIFVYRDFPLPFHDPAATQEANAVECARKLGGDKAYFQFHDQIYKQTPGNGTGISESNLIKIGTDLGLNAESLTTCIRNEEFAAEIKKDIADAAQVGINGTPGFVIGILSPDGQVEGEVLSGAQPYANFAQVIDRLLGS